MNQSLFTFTVGFLTLTELDPNLVEIRNEAIDKTFQVSTDNGTAAELALDILFRGTGLTRDTVQGTFEDTCPGYKKAS
jgi:hypothetical protein